MESRAITHHEAEDTEIFLKPQSVFSVEHIIKQVNDSYYAWNDNDNRAVQSLYHLLGRIFSVVPFFEQSQDAMFDLRRAVKRHPDIKGKRAFKVDRKTPLELLLTLVLGTKSHKGRKSQWKAAILGAPAELPRTEEAYVEWVSRPHVGMSGARKAYLRTVSATGKPKVGRSLAELVSVLEETRFESPPLKIDPQRPVTFPEGIGLLLFRTVADEGSEGSLCFQPLEIVDDTKIIHNAAEYAATSQFIRPGCLEMPSTINNRRSRFGGRKLAKGSTLGWS